MAIIEDKRRVWNDDDEMPRMTRIAELLRASTLMRPCRRHDDPALWERIEAEFTLLLDAESIRLQ
jgi:hypothetical protein